jgi:hypothetical protein
MNRFKRTFDFDTIEIHHNATDNQKLLFNLLHDTLLSNLSAFSEDIGIGSYEYWGAEGHDSCWVNTIEETEVQINLSDELDYAYTECMREQDGDDLVLSLWLIQNDDIGETNRECYDVTISFDGGGANTALFLFAA